VEITKIGDLRDKIGQITTIQGWVDVIRNQKTMQFLVIRDETGKIQAVNTRQGDTLDERIASLTPDSTVLFTGTVVENDKVKLGGIEVQIINLEITSKAESPLPIEENTNLDQRLDWRFVDLRRPEARLIFQVQTAIEQAMRQFWHEEGFIEIHSPKITGSPSESGAELFSLPYFGKTAYLAQSPQFYKQMAMAAGLGKIFEIGPVFRANPSFTSRHDTEFTSVDVEFSWITSHEDVMQLEEHMLRRVLQFIADLYGEQIKEYFSVDVRVPTIPFPRIPLAEAIKLIKERGWKEPLDFNGDLDPEGERALAKYIVEMFNHEFVFVTDYPVHVRAFYHMRHADNPQLTKSFDLLWKGLEVTTGAQREHRYNILLAQAMEKGLSQESIDYYLDFFRFGCPPHGGFGLGLTRILMTALGIKNVREVTYLYRGPNRIKP
jgi:nondiscriminating aspartyl-tRNA synthetase